MCSIEKRGRVFVLTITGDGEHRLSPALINAIRSAVAHAKSDYNASLGGMALIITSDGRFFSNGFDLAWSKSALTPASTQERLNSMKSLFADLVVDLISLPMPTVAAVNGHAAAAGFILAMCHDYVEMRADRGVIYMSEIDIGMVLPSYFTALIRSKVSGPRVVRDLLLRGDKIRASEAMAKRIVDGSHVSAEETMKAAMVRAEALAEREWNGDVYASIRRSWLPEVFLALGLPKESEEELKKPPLMAAKI